MTRKKFVSDEQAEELVKRLYDKASSEEPSPDIDQQILARAKTATESGQDVSHPPRKSPLQFWQRFGSIAATLVLVVTVGMLYQENRNQLAPENPVILTSDPESMHATGRQESGEDMARQDSAASLEEAAVQAPAEPEPADPIKQQQAEAGTTFNDTAADQAPAPRKALSSPSADTVAPVQQQTRPAPAAAESLSREKKSVKAELAEPALEESQAIEERMAPGMMRSFSAGPKTAAPAPEKQSLTAPSVAKIREAIAVGELEKAEALWLELKATFPDAELPGDLVEFFGNDHQVGQPQQIDGDAGSNQHQ